MLCFHVIRLHRYGNAKNIRVKAMELWISPVSEWSHIALHNIFCTLLKSHKVDFLFICVSYLFRFVFFICCIRNSKYRHLRGRLSVRRGSLRPDQTSVLRVIFERIPKTLPSRPSIGESKKASMETGIVLRQTGFRCTNKAWRLS